MLAKLYVGNLPIRFGDAELSDLFRDLGEVQSALVILDRDDGRSRGFGFVVIQVDHVDAAIQAINGREIDGRRVRVHEAEDKL